MRQFFLILLVMMFGVCHGQITDSLRNQLKVVNTDSAEIAILNSLAKEYLKTSLDTSYIYVQQSLTNPAISNYPRLHFEAINLCGNYFQRIGEFKEAKSQYDLLIPIAEVLNDDKAWSTYYNNAGIIYMNLTQFDTALVFYQKALDYEIALKDSTGIAEAYNNIGVIHFYAGNTEKCLEYITRSIDIQELSKGEYAVLLKGYNNLGAIYEHYQKNHDSAFKYYDKARMLSDSLNELRDLSITLNNLSGLFQAKGDFDQAIGYARDSYDLRIKQNNKEGMATSLINMALIEQLRPNYIAAENYLTQALALAEEIGSYQLILQSHNEMATNYELKGEFKNALANARFQLAWTDSVYNKNKDETIAELETKYETEKKEQQIALQEAEISQQQAELGRRQILLIASLIIIIAIVALALTQRSRLNKKQQIRLQEEQLKTREAEINATISSQEKERARYARDLHDGFGQMISILNMNLKNLEGDAKPDDRQKVFEESSKVIDDMYAELKNICFDLMPQTLIESGLENALKEFVDRINTSNQIFVDLNVFGLEERLYEIQEISLYRISQEWINNILKYSDAQKVTLQITRDEGEITLLIEDDGTGFDRSKLTSGKGNGWKNLNTRTNLIKGELELETVEGKKGNTLIVNAPSQSQKEESIDKNTVEMV